MMEIDRGEKHGCSFGIIWPGWPELYIVIHLSSGSGILRFFSQALYVAHRGNAKEAFVLPIEVGGVLVATLTRFAYHFNWRIGDIVSESLTLSLNYMFLI